MRKILMGAAAALAVAAPGAALADSAEVGAHIGNIDAESGGDLDYWGLDGAYSHDFASGWTLQLDGTHESLDAGGGDLGTSYGAVNLGMRSGGHAFYGFVGLSDIVALSFTNIGVGGQLYLGNVTLNGSVGYAWGDAGGDIEVLNAHVDGTWFFTDNFGIMAEAGWAELDASGGGDNEVETLGLGGVFRFTGSPVAINLNYRNVDTDSTELDVWQIGFTYHIGTGSERERSQSGASWNGAENLYRSTLYGIF